MQQTVEERAALTFFNILETDSFIQVLVMQHSQQINTVVFVHKVEEKAIKELLKQDRLPSCHFEFITSMYCITTLTFF